MGMIDVNSCLTHTIEKKKIKMNNSQYKWWEQWNINILMVGYWKLCYLWGFSVGYAIMKSGKSVWQYSRV